MYIKPRTSRGINLKHAVTFIEPPSPLRRDPLGRVVGSDTEGSDMPFEHTGYYCAFLPRRSVERNTDDDSLVSMMPAAIVLRHSALMDRVNANWEVVVLGKRHRVAAEPEPFIEAGRFVRIQIRRAS